MIVRGVVVRPRAVQDERAREGGPMVDRDDAEVRVTGTFDPPVRPERAQRFPGQLRWVR